jgi:hypothetical protein
MNCVMNSHMDPLKTSQAPTTNINCGINPSLYEDIDQDVFVADSVGLKQDFFDMPINRNLTANVFSLLRLKLLMFV